MSVLTDRNFPNPLMIAQALDSLTLHNSPPPTLAARFGDLQNVGSSPIDSSIYRDLDSTMRSPPRSIQDPQAALQEFIDHLLSSDHADSDPNLLAIGYELEALLSIYPNAVKLSISSRPGSISTDLHEHAKSSNSSPSDTSSSNGGMKRQSSSSQTWEEAVYLSEWFSPGERIRYEITLPIWESGDTLDGVVPLGEIPAIAPGMRILVSLPPTYPNSSPPQLQLLGRYLGAFPIDAGLFGDITRTYISSSGIPFTPGDVCVFEGLTYAVNHARKWYIERLSEGAEGEKLREADRRRGKEGRAMSDLPDGSFPTSPVTLKVPPNPEFDSEPSLAGSSGENVKPKRPSPRPTFSYTKESKEKDKDKEDEIQVDGESTPQVVTEAETGNGTWNKSWKIHVSEPIVDRKSTFIGHAIKVTDEREVPLVIHEILSDKKVAKAAHPAMFAYRIAKHVGGAAGVIYATDCDDDGESAAGTRLAHLLEILEVENVLVVVSRWYGGTLLGADRFKHINQAARDALEIGGFLEDRDTPKDKKGRRK